MEDDKEESGAKTMPNPEGFFADLEDMDACSVAVAVRVRPLVGRELTAGNRREVIQSGIDESTKHTKLQMGAKSFDFDAVFWPDDTQEFIFDRCTRNLVLGCFSGFNATILAYGQTGSGKTHSMGTGCTLGVPFEEVGIVPRVFKFIFDELELRRAQSEYSEFKVRISFLEIYNEELHDLLDPASMVRDKQTGKPQKELTIREEKNVISIRGLKELEVTTTAECLHWLNTGINHRMTSATLMNEGSSRSHGIFTVTIEQKIVKDIEDAGDVAANPAEGEEKAQVTEEISSKFHFVDLAGSERIKKTGATGLLLKEGISINKGLLCLGQVISALTDMKSKGHIPYRDSKLTRILQDSLGGNSRTTMIACVSPAESNFDESMGTVKYASRARNIKNKPIVNRDANSLLIEALRKQISTLQFEVNGIISFVKKSGLTLPPELADKEAMASKQKEIEAPKKKQQLQIQQSSGNDASGGAEVKDLKIKLSHKDKEIRELQQKLNNQQVFLDKKDKLLKETEKERDNITLQTEAMAELLKSNNIEFDASSFQPKAGGGESAASKEAGKASAGLVDQYKLKLAKAQKDVDQKIRELQGRDQQYLQLKQAQDRNDRILKKHIDENQALKKQLQSGGGGSFIQRPQAASAEPSKKRDFKTMRAERKKDQSQVIEDFNSKFLTDLQSQIDDMFSNASTRKVLKGIEGTGQDGAVPDAEGEIDQQEASIIEGAAEDCDKDAAENGETGEEGDGKLVSKEIVGQTVDREVIEKEKMLAGVRQYAISMSTDIKDLLKNEWAGAIKSLEGEKSQAETDVKTKISQAKNDQKLIQQIEKDHRSKMEVLNQELAKQARDKQKKEESVAKQIATQELRIKALEADLEKQKKKKEEVEKAKKFDENRFFKFKQDIGKDLHAEKKKISEKDKQMTKLKNDLKKVDQLAQQKIAQLRGLQKRAQEEKQKRDAQEEKELQTKGIDIDLIKAWISSNTEAMLQNQELKEYLEKQTSQKDKVENEMLEEGDRMTELLMLKEKLEYEKDDLTAMPEDQKDEGRILEIEDQLKDIGMEISSITETLDMLEETLEFVQARVHQVTEEIESFDLDSIQPLSFNALDSIESAKATLKTFFQIVLDLNIYKRDLENKCIEQDDNIIRLQAGLNSQEARVQYMIQNGGNDGYATQIAKANAINSVLRQVDGFIDNRDVEHLNLNPTEQTNLTKLSLSKIVNNLKKNLKDYEVKNQQISLKLDQALKQKEIYKSRSDELKAQLKNASYGVVQQSSQPRTNQNFKQVESKLNSHQNQNQANNSFEQNRPRTQSFKERQKQKQMNIKPVVSLADRRKSRGGQFLDQGQSDDFGSNLNNLKQSADHLLTEKGLLEEIDEEEIPDIDFDYNNQVKRQMVLESIDEDNDEYETSKLMKNKNNNRLGVPNMNETDANVSMADMDLTENWVQEIFTSIEYHSKLINFFYLGTKMICIFQDFQVNEVDMTSKQISKSYNLQEIEGFEISEDCEEDMVIAFALEKDVQLIGIACVTNVHIFEYSEEEENSLTHVSVIQQGDITQIVFVDYHIILVQNKSDYGYNKIICYDPDGKDENGSTQIDMETVIIEAGSESIYFAAGNQLGKISVPDMTEIYRTETQHKGQILDMAVSSLNQIIITSKDGDIRFFNIEDGKQCAEPLEEMDCDHMETYGIHLLTRIGNGEALVIWRLLPNGGVDESPLGEVELETVNIPRGGNAKFLMKGGCSATSEQNQGRETEGLIMMQEYLGKFVFNLLTQKLQRA